MVHKWTFDKSVDVMDSSLYGGLEDKILMKRAGRKSIIDPHIKTASRLRPEAFGKVGKKMEVKRKQLAIYMEQVRILKPSDILLEQCGF